MNNVVRLAIVDPNDATRNSMKSLLLGLDMVWLEAECSRYEFFSDVVSQTHPDIAIINLDSESEQGLRLVASVNAQLPQCSILVVSSSQEGSLILQAMRNGAREFLSYPLKLEDLLSALERIHAALRSRSSEGEDRKSQVITVTGVGGGVGCTSLAINLACVMANNPSNSVTLMDLDLALGDADVWLDIIPEYTIQDVTENITRLDYSLLKRSLTKHECGAFLLPRPVQMDDRTATTPDELKRVVALLRATFSHLVIDVSKSYSPLDLAAMEVSDTILLVTQLDLPCLRNVVRLVEYFEQNDTPPDKVKIVVNRLGLEDSQISLNKALETIGRDVFWQVPNDYATMVESRNNGIPLILQSPRAKLTRSVEQLANAIDISASSEEETEEAKPKKRLFGFLGSGSK